MIDALIRHKDGIITAFWETNYMLFSSMAISFVFSIILGTLLYALRKDFLIKNKVCYHMLSIALNTLRSIPFLIFIFLLIPLTRFIFKTSFGNTPAIFPLTLVSLSIYSRFVEQALLSVPIQIIERAKSMGATRMQIIRYFLFPVIKPQLILSFTSVVISVLSYSTVMGVIGAGGLGEYAFRYGYQEYDYDLLYLMAIIFVLYVFMIQTIGYRLAKYFTYTKEK